MNTTARTATLMTQLVDAEAALKTARREEARTAGIADRAADRAAKARTAAATARREAAKTERTGTKGLAAATRRAATLTAKAATLTATAKDAKATAAAARRTARAAARRVDSLALRAARTASRAIGKIAERLGKTTLTAAPAADRTLPAAELPTVTEIETRADEFADLDAKAKAAAKKADAVKKWLRQLPVGTFGRVTITRTPSGTVIDNDQVAIDYFDAGLGVPPRKGRRDTFKVLVATAPAVDVTGLAVAA
ncbi:hypothetical protein [Streptomyces sp. NPDC057250]|uniref:hypothetical protein n=1 Tax=Streptomyces sp. NPDC057250 TaxID=3346068 RepID=UPI003626E07C